MCKASACCAHSGEGDVFPSEKTGVVRSRPIVLNVWPCALLIVIA